MPTARRLILLIAVGVLVVAAGVGIYGLVRGPGHPLTASRTGSPSAAAAPSSTTSTAAGTHAAGERPAALPRTDDPIVYAEAVAAALFDWDSAAGLTPADYTAVVLADADPTGEEVPGLIADVASYEPTTDQWTQLAGMRVVQRLSITSAAVPSLWPHALAQADGQLRPGTTAVTISGVRHRTGVWYDQRAATADPVSFTVFLACAPAFPRCHTLRLSQLNGPLK